MNLRVCFCSNLDNYWRVIIVYSMGIIATNGIRVVIMGLLMLNY